MGRSHKHKEPSCRWTADDEGNWDTQCEQKHVLIDGGPKDNQMRFCCYCGGALVERPYREDKP